MLRDPNRRQKTYPLLRLPASSDSSCLLSAYVAVVTGAATELPQRTRLALSQRLAAVDDPLNARTSVDLASVGSTGSWSLVQVDQWGRVVSGSTAVSSASSLSSSYAAGATQADQTIALASSKGGGLLVTDSTTPQSFELRVASAGGSTVHFEVREGVVLAQTGSASAPGLALRTGSLAVGFSAVSDVLVFHASGSQLAVLSGSRLSLATSAVAQTGAAVPALLVASTLAASASAPRSSPSARFACSTWNAAAVSSSTASWDVRAVGEHASGIVSSLRFETSSSSASEIARFTSDGDFLLASAAVLSSSNGEITAAGEDESAFAIETANNNSVGIVGTGVNYRKIFPSSPSSVTVDDGTIFGLAPGATVFSSTQYGCGFYWTVNNNGSVYSYGRVISS